MQLHDYLKIENLSVTSSFGFEINIVCKNDI